MSKRVLTSFFILFLACAAHARNFVVCVGISNYPGRINDLNVSAKDPRLLKSLYDTNGKASTSLFTDSHATTKNVVAALHRACSQAGEGDAVLFFFSGHGVNGGFVCYDDILSYRTITGIMKKSRAKSKMVFADACYAGAMRKGNKRDNSYSSENVMFFLSSRTDEVSRERKGWKNSIFTTYLVKGLRGMADANRDRRITARELFNFVSKNVKTSTKNRQHPVMWGKFDGNMTILKW